MRKYLALIIITIFLGSLTGNVDHRHPHLDNEVHKDENKARTITYKSKKIKYLLKGSILYKRNIK